MKQIAIKIFLFFWLLSASVSSFAAAPFIQPELSLRQSEARIILAGNLNYLFSQAALDAIDNGLPLSMTTELKIVSPGNWFFDKTAWIASYHQQIQYHALSQQYLVKGIRSEYPKTFLTKAAAIDALGSIAGFALTDKVTFDPNKKYELKLRSKIDINSLPIPLRPLAYLSDGWKLRSEWKTWPIR